MNYSLIKLISDDCTNISGIGTQQVFYDETCAFGGLGCNAGGLPNCRFCNQSFPECPLTTTTTVTIKATSTLSTTPKITSTTSTKTSTLPTTTSTLLTTTIPNINDYYLVQLFDFDKDNHGISFEFPLNNESNSSLAIIESFTDSNNHEITDLSSTIKLTNKNQSCMFPFVYNNTMCNHCCTDKFECNTTKGYDTCFKDAKFSGLFIFLANAEFPLIQTIKDSGSYLISFYLSFYCPSNCTKINDSITINLIFDNKNKTFIYSFSDINNTLQKGQWIEKLYYLTTSPTNLTVKLDFKRIQKTARLVTHIGFDQFEIKLIKKHSLSYLCDFDSNDCGGSFINNLISNSSLQIVNKLAIGSDLSYQITDVSSINEPTSEDNLTCIFPFNNTQFNCSHCCTEDLQCHTSSGLKKCFKGRYLSATFFKFNTFNESFTFPTIQLPEQGIYMIKYYVYMYCSDVNICKNSRDSVQFKYKYKEQYTLNDQDNYTTIDDKDGKWQMRTLSFTADSSLDLDITVTFEQVSKLAIDSYFGFDNLVLEKLTTTTSTISTSSTDSTNSNSFLSITSASFTAIASATSTSTLITTTTITPLTTFISSTASITTAITSISTLSTSTTFITTSTLILTTTIPITSNEVLIKTTSMVKSTIPTTFIETTTTEIPLATTPIETTQIDLSTFQITSTEPASNTTRMIESTTSVSASTQIAATTFSITTEITSIQTVSSQIDTSNSPTSKATSSIFSTTKPITTKTTSSISTVTVIENSTNNTISSSTARKSYTSEIIIGVTVPIAFFSLVSFIFVFLFCRKRYFSKVEYLDEDVEEPEEEDDEVEEYEME